MECHQVYDTPLPALQIVYSSFLQNVHFTKAVYLLKEKFKEQLNNKNSYLSSFLTHLYLPKRDRKEIK